MSKKKSSTAVFVHPTLKNTFMNTFVILLIAIAGAAAYWGIDLGMTNIVSLLF